MGLSWLYFRRGMLPPWNGLVAIGSRSRLALNGTGFCPKRAHSFADRFDCAAVDAPGEEQDEAPAINSLFRSGALVDAEQVHGIPTVLDRHNGVMAGEEIQGRILEPLPRRAGRLNLLDCGAPFRDIWLGPSSPMEMPPCEPTNLALARG